MITVHCRRGRIFQAGGLVRVYFQRGGSKRRSSKVHLMPPGVIDRVLVDDGERGTETMKCIVALKVMGGLFLVEQMPIRHDALERDLPAAQDGLCFRLTGTKSADFGRTQSVSGPIEADGYSFLPIVEVSDGGTGEAGELPSALRFASRSL